MISHIERIEVHNAVRRFFLAKEKPSTMFERTFFELREKAKKFKKDLESSVVSKLKQKIVSDVESKGAKVVSSDIKLGNYRGSGFITSSPLVVKVESVEKAKELLAYLIVDYSPKWKLKSFENGIAEYNVR